MGPESATIVTIITKLAPKLYTKAMKAFTSSAMSPKDKDLAIMKEYLSLIENRRVFNSRQYDAKFDPVLISVDEIRINSYNYAAKLSEFLPGQVMIEAICDACKGFLDKWVESRGKGYSVTYDGGHAHKDDTMPDGVRLAVPLFEAFALDLLHLRADVNLLQSGIAEMIHNANTSSRSWNGWVVGEVTPTLLDEFIKGAQEKKR